ncbi:MAG TPA: tetratricopeptide repeat protein [Planctomycetota bacterium]|jgi:tetratricopeptide (TPR) repeat protein|nr:tetratricopeptide repeat protein [Planctomycetota bacterium]
MKHTALACLLAFAFAGPVRADERSDIDAIWNDPIFKRQFIAGYGINSEVEPRVTPEEVAILEKIRPLMADNLPKAEESLRKQMKPECSAILDFTLGGIQFQQDRMADALANYTKAVAKFPSFRRAWRNLGLINVRGGNYDAAISAFTRMIELGGGDAYAYGLLGFAYSSKSDFQPAEAAYRGALLLQPENTEWRLGLTRCVFKQQKFEDAAALLDVLIERFPDKADFWLLQAHTFLGLKQPLKAAANFEAVDRLGKGTVDSLHTLGDLYVSENLMDLAARAYQRAIDVDPAQPLARPIHAAEVLIARNAMPQAREVVMHIKLACAQIQDGDRRKLLKLEARLSMAEGGGNADTAKILEEVVQIDPLDGEALMLLGQHYGRQNEPDRAILYYERAASLDAFEVNAKIRHAQVLVGMARYADAIPLLRRAQEVRPREDIARYLEQVERIAKARH